jgi:hypothetical protein
VFVLGRCFIVFLIELCVLNADYICVPFNNSIFVLFLSRSM